VSVFAVAPRVSNRSKFQKIINPKNGLEEKQMTEYEARNFLPHLERYLLTALGSKIADEIKGKIAEKLGCGSWWSLINLDYPYKKVVETVGMGFGLMSFYAYWIQNKHFGTNPYNPAKEDERDQYVQYLLYSWAGGKPGYMYQFSKQAEKAKADANTIEAKMANYGYR
jgi:hypothetical protein